MPGVPQRCSKKGNSTFNTAIVLVHLVGSGGKQNNQIISGVKLRYHASLPFILSEKFVRLSPELLQIMPITNIVLLF